MRPLLIALSLTLALPGCARLAASPVNPLNWFGITPTAPQVLQTPAEAPASLVPEGAVAVLDLRQPVAQVTGLQLDRSPDGILVTATGLAASPGAFNAALVETARSGSTLTLDMRAELPPEPAPGGQSLTVGLMLPNAALGGISRIVVTSAGNSLSAAR